MATSGIVFGCVVPHPPVLLPEVGHDMAAAVQSTVDAMREVGGKIAAYEPDTLVLISPHGPLQRDAMSIGMSPEARGDFAHFNAPLVGVQAMCDVELAEGIRQASGRVAIEVRPVDELTGAPGQGVYWLDHGAAVPLHFLLPFVGDVKVVLLGYSFQPRATHQSFGERIRQACEEAGRRAVFVASGDLSHRLAPGAPAGYEPEGRLFDEEIVAALAAGDWGRIRTLPSSLVERAGVCGYMSILTLAGAMGEEVDSRVLSYQGPFGVGYVVSDVAPAARPRQGERLDGDSFAFPEADFAAQVVALARASVEAYVQTRRRVNLPAAVPEGFLHRQSCFVTLRRNGELRGCVGTVAPMRDSLAAEIVENAIGAGMRDYRFPPLQPEELPDVCYSVDVLSPLEPSTMEDMDPARYGMVVIQGARAGVLLPAIPEVRDVRHQFEVCCHKAGITSPADIELRRFTVTRYGEPGADH